MATVTHWSTPTKTRPCTRLRCSAIPGLYYVPNTKTNCASGIICRSSQDPRHLNHPSASYRTVHTLGQTASGWLELHARQSDPPPQCALSGRACIIIGQIHYQQRFKVAHKTRQYTKKLPCALEYTIQKHAHRFSHGLLIELTLLVADIFFCTES